MKEERFRKKDQIMREYEDIFFAEVEERFKPYKEELAECGIEMLCQKFYDYPDDSSIEDMTDQRLPVQQKKRYECWIVIDFSKEDSNVETESYYFIGGEITRYAVFKKIFFINLWRFRKFSKGFFYWRMEREIKKLKKYGFEKRCSRYARRNKSDY